MPTNSTIEKIELKLANGKLLSGLTCGNGPIPCLIVGPASFYFGKLSENLKQQMTFYAFDEEWSCDKGTSIDTNAIETFTFSDLIDKTASIVNALKEQFHYPKIGLMGFSAPGLIAPGAAKIIGTEHIAFVIGSGLASSKLDPEFKATADYFEKHAEVERRNRFKRDNDNFAALAAGNENGEPLPDANFIIVNENSNTKKRSLSPNSFWAEFVRSLETKQVYAYNDEKIVNQLIAEWRFNPIGKVMSEPMRNHFFTKILSQIDPKAIIDDVLNIDIPFMMVYGEHDYTTPPPKKMDRQQWGTYRNFLFEKYKESVHYPSWEPGSQQKFDEDIKKFLDAQGVTNLFIENSNSNSITHSI